MSIEKKSGSDYLIHTEITINAPRQKVWEVLTDFDKMPEWSSSFQGVDGDFKEGGIIVSKYKMPFGKMAKVEHPLVTCVEGEEFSWSSDIGLGMIDHHIFRLESIYENTTKFVQTDEPHDGATRILGGVVSHMLENMYHKFNTELKERVENL